MRAGPLLGIALVTGCGRLGFDSADRSDGGLDHDPQDAVAGSVRDGMGTADDLDGDGVPNVVDHCIMVGNSTQADEDADGPGNACDNCPGLPVGWTTNGGGQVDFANGELAFTSDHVSPTLACSTGSAT